jgi:hypothetical protein
MALKAMTAASSAATSRFCCRTVPNWLLPEQSEIRRTVSSRSSMKRLTGLVLADLLEGDAGAFEDAVVFPAQDVLHGAARPQLKAADLA